jgi:hypothetical protein
MIVCVLVFLVLFDIAAVLNDCINWCYSFLVVMYCCFIVSLWGCSSEQIMLLCWCSYLEMLLILDNFECIWIPAMLNIYIFEQWYSRLFVCIRGHVSYTLIVSVRLLDACFCHSLWAMGIWIRSVFIFAFFKLVFVFCILFFFSERKLIWFGESVTCRCQTY